MECNKDYLTSGKPLLRCDKSLLYVCFKLIDSQFSWGFAVVN